MQPRVWSSVGPKEGSKCGSSSVSHSLVAQVQGGHRDKEQNKPHNLSGPMLLIRVMTGQSEPQTQFCRGEF